MRNVLNWYHIFLLLNKIKRFWWKIINHNQLVQSQFLKWNAITYDYCEHGHGSDHNHDYNNYGFHGGYNKSNFNKSKINEKYENGEYS
jgi:hypothetical protein